MTASRDLQGLVLRSARHTARLSQRALAKRAGVPASTVAAAESAARELRVSDFAALLTACGWTLQVLDGAGAPQDATQLRDGPRDAAARRYPAHVELRSTEKLGSWWGDRWGPYWGRPPRPPRTFDLPRRSYGGAVSEPAEPAEPAEPPRVQRLAAYAVLCNDSGQVLLARLSDGTDRPGWWTLPGGGVEHGEHPRDTVVREVREETGLTVEVADLLDLRSFHRPAGEGFAWDLHSLQAVYRATVRVDSGPLVSEADGTTDLARWVTLEEAAALPLVELARATVGALTKPVDLSP